jgi:hypothetical protein
MLEWAMDGSTLQRMVALRVTKVEAEAGGIAARSCMSPFE